MFKIINALPAALLAACMLAMHEVKGAPVASIDNPDEPATASGFSGASLSDVPLREKTESHKGEYYTRGATLVDRTDSNTPRVYLPLKAVIASSSDRSLQCVLIHWVGGSAIISSQGPMPIQTGADLLYEGGLELLLAQAAVARAILAGLRSLPLSPFR
ncbi:hypothetical protein P389DRAFT_179121 [Cystobasidium minutum MCA 4210]|uniref:uncharacterized protein n=1 Tax=Cystobasidium minutum MCA 4210 TaxID=1397322 RepID=UPI0034CFE508|eukprot:jgi/Rhomi1/179121/fgenesh1_pg.3_\